MLGLQRRIPSYRFFAGAVSHDLEFTIAPTLGSIRCVILSTSEGILVGVASRGSLWLSDTFLFTFFKRLEVC